MLRARIFDPRLATKSSRHAELYLLYQTFYAVCDCGAAIAFVIGSVCFLYQSLHDAAAWLFIIGSVLFAAVPAISITQGMHLRRLPSD